MESVVDRGVSVSGARKELLQGAPTPIGAAACGNTNADPLLWDLKKAATEAGLTVWQLRGLIARGELKVVDVAGKFYVRPGTLTRWVERAEGLVA